MRTVCVSSCNLNQWSLDFVGNRDRVIKAVSQAKKDGASLLITPELSISGYDCLDAFQELDTERHSWEVLAGLLTECTDILVDVGMPVQHKNVLYNARVVFYNRQILYVRPKMSLANDGLFREMRYFSPWPRDKVDDHLLPSELQNITGQRDVPIGNIVLETLDGITIACEMCEELFTPQSPSISYGLAGVDVICNSSASHWSLRKLDRRLELIKESSKKSGSCYLYANQQGCDGAGRQYYDGCSLIVLNGNVVAQGTQFSLNEVEVITAVVDLEESWLGHFQPARSSQAALEPTFHKVRLNKRLGLSDTLFLSRKPSRTFEPVVLKPEEEIARAGGCWLWDYLRRSRQAGFFLPLSGGIDSCATAIIVHSMARLLSEAVESGNHEVIRDLRTVAGESLWQPQGASDICNKIFHTCFMGTTNSSRETRSRARQLAKTLGSYHLDVDIDTIVNAFTSLYSAVFLGRRLRYKSEPGGSVQEGLALQNIQSRSRMVLAYLFASTLTIVRQRKDGGSLLVLGSANVDEARRGYYTKYDNSSADINPIGGISKTDLRRLIDWARAAWDLPILEDFLTATPTAELEPISDTYVQSDEADMGVTYEELGVFGRLRKIDKLGPYSMWRRLCNEWTHMSPGQIYTKVAFLWHYFGINRHKQETLTPSLHAETYSPDSNRYDLLPFLRPRLTWAYNKIEATLKEVEKVEESAQDGDAASSEADGVDGA